MSTVRRCGTRMCKAKKYCPALVRLMYVIDERTTSDISHELHIPIQSVCNILRRHGIVGYVSRRDKVADICIGDIEREYLAGASTYELGERYGVNHATISKWMRKRGHCRGKGGGPKATQGLRSGREELHKRKREEAVKCLRENPAIELIEYVDCKTAQVRCTKCGTEYRWGFWSRDADEPCPCCREQQRETERLVRERKQYEREQQRIAAREWRLSVPRICAECGEPFYSEYEGATYCCDKCCRRAGHRRDVKRGRAGGYRKRMRIVRTKAAYDPSVTLNAVYKRFKGKCCACGCKVYRSKEYRPDQATLDHIIALANNGTHTWDNVQLLCSDCNSKKRDFGQMRLPIAV